MDKKLEEYLDDQLYVYTIDRRIVNIPFKYEQSAKDHASIIKNSFPDLSVQVEQSPDKMGYDIIVNC